MQRDDPRNTDQKNANQENTEQPKPLSPSEEIVDASPTELPIEGDVEAGNSVITPEPSAPLDQSAASEVPTSAPSASDLSERESDGEPRLEPRQEEAASIADTPTQLAGNVTRFELPAEIIIPPTRPPEAGRDRRSHLLPLDPGGASGDEPDPVDEIFPPELRLPSDPGVPSRAPVAGPAPPQVGPPFDSGQTMPRVQVIVSLAGGRALFEEGLEVALREAAPKFEQIAQSEIERYDSRQVSKRRAADYRLRGPG